MLPLPSLMAYGYVCGRNKLSCSCELMVGNTSKYRIATIPPPGIANVDTEIA